MPTTSVSGILSTSVYFMSMVLLLGTLAPSARTAYADAGGSSAKHLAQVLATQIDDLSPGMTSRLSFSSFPGVTTSVLLSGQSVTATVDGSSASAPVSWQLGEHLLSADRDYLVNLNGGVLEVA